MIFFFFNDTATTEIYTLSLHDALPIYHGCAGPEPRLGAASAVRASGLHQPARAGRARPRFFERAADGAPLRALSRSEEHTSELQSRQYLVCRLLLEKKKAKHNYLDTDL